MPIKKKKSNTTRSHVNPTKSSGISLAPAQTLTLAGSGSASVCLQGVITPRWARAPFLTLEGPGSLEEAGTEGEEAVGGEWRKRR